MSQIRWKALHDHRHTSFDGRLYLERRPTLSPNWFVRCWINGKPLSKTSKSPMLGDAKVFAERWFTKLLHRLDAGEPVSEQTLADAYKAFLHWHEHDLLATGASNAKKIKNYKSLWNGIKACLGDVGLSGVTSQQLETFRTWRVAASLKDSKRALTEKTLHNYLGLIGLVLRYAVRHGWLTHLPPFPQLRLKHAHPEWFTPEQFQALLAVSMSRIAATKHSGNAAAHIRAERMELHAFILLMAHGCIRVDECLNLHWQDVRAHVDNDKVPPFKRLVHLNIADGKTGSRQGVGTVGVLTALNYLRALHPDAQTRDKLFHSSHQRGMAKLLTAATLRVDSHGKLRTMKTLRHQWDRR